MKPNTRDGQRHVAKALAERLGKGKLVSTRHLRKLQCQVLIHAMLNRKPFRLDGAGNLRVKL